MTATTGQPSATPILDLLQPLPKPDTERINGRFAFPFLTVVAAIVLTGNLPSLLVPFGFLLINFLTTLIHELGHLVAGWCVGLRFAGVRVDPFSLRLDSGRWKFRVRPKLFWGFAFMSLDRVRRVRRRLIVVTAGGPLASIVCGAAAVIAGEWGLARYDSPWPTLLDFFGVWSIFIGCIGLFSYRAGAYASDGMLLRALLFSKTEATQIVASHALFIVKNDGLLPPDYFRRWFRLASIQTKLQGENYYANWLAYEGEQDQGIAAQFLERCLAASARMNEDQRDKLIVEAISFLAYRRNEVAKAEIWSKRLMFPDRLDPLSQIRITIALSCARMQFDCALEGVERGLILIRQAPMSAERQRYEAVWTSRRQEIQQRIGAHVA